MITCSRTYIFQSDESPFICNSIKIRLKTRTHKSYVNMFAKVQHSLNMLSSNLIFVAMKIYNLTDNSVRS